MSILFVLGFPNPFPAAGWTRIGFFTKDCSKKRHKIEVLDAFNYYINFKRKPSSSIPKLPSRSKTARIKNVPSDRPIINILMLVHETKQGMGPHEV